MAAATSDVAAGPPSLLERAFADALDGAEVEDPNSAILDAAYDLFCRQGIQRTTMEDVARRARVSRITVYRRLVSKEALVEAVLLRDFRLYVDRFLADLAGAQTVADRVVTGFVSSLRATRSNPLMTGLMQAEPGAVAPTIVGEDGRVLAAVARFLAGQLRIEQRAGNVGPDVDVDVVAELMVRLSASFFLTPSEVVDLDDDEQVAGIARRYLVPMLQA